MLLTSFFYYDPYFDLGAILPYQIQCQNLGQYLDEFVEELITEFSIDGVEIAGKRKSLGIHKMDIKYEDEKGNLEVSKADEDLKIVYDIKRERKEISKGMAGAVSGAGLGSFIRGAFSSSRKLSDQVSTAVGGAIAGGAYKAYEGYEESKLDRTKFAQLLAKTVNEVEDELNKKHQALSRDKKQSSPKDEDNNQLDTLFNEINLGILSLKEELGFAEKPEEDLQRVKVRLTRAEELYKEAETKEKEGDVDEAKVRATVARNMLKKAQDLYSKS